MGTVKVVGMPWPIVWSNLLSYTIRTFKQNLTWKNVQLLYNLRAKPLKAKNIAQFKKNMIYSLDSSNLTNKATKIYKIKNPTINKNHIDMHRDHICRVDAILEKARRKECFSLNIFPDQRNLPPLHKFFQKTLISNPPVPYPYGVLFLYVPAPIFLT